MGSIIRSNSPNSTWKALFLETPDGLIVHFIKCVCQHFAVVFLRTLFRNPGVVYSLILISSISSFSQDYRYEKQLRVVEI